MVDACTILSALLEAASRGLGVKASLLRGESSEVVEYVMSYRGAADYSL